jgi:thioredoxin 1
MPWCQAADTARLVGSLLLVREVNDETFEAEVVRAEQPVVVDFWAPWCGPCKAVEPVLADLAEALDGRVGFAKLNIDENPVTASRYGVLSIPTAILFAGGEARQSVIGARSKAHYEQAWADWL